MIIDGLIVYALHRWETNLKKEKELILEKEAIKHETVKKSNRMEKAATREQTKAHQKQQKIQNIKVVNKKHNIQQPDKSKKMK